MKQWTILIAAAALCPGNLIGASPSPTPPESAANKYMHQTSIEQLAAHFEDPGRKKWQKPDEVIAGPGPLAGKTVADIGAGTGYFSFPIAARGAKVIAIDIDQRFLDYIEARKQKEKTKGEIEVRPTTPDSPGLKPGEADVILIVDTWHHIEDHPSYLKKLREALHRGGTLVIIDFKKEETPEGPPPELRLTAAEVQSELHAAGFKIASTDEKTLPYQYIIKAR